MSTSFGTNPFIDDETLCESGEAIEFFLSGHHIEIVKYLDGVTLPHSLDVVLENGIGALTDCFMSNTFHNTFKPYTSINGKNVNPVSITTPSNFPNWISRPNVKKIKTILPISHVHSDKIFQMIMAGGYRDENEAISHLLRFLVLVYNQKCRGKKIFYCKLMSPEETIVHNKKRMRANYKYWEYNIFEQYEFPFKVAH